MSGISGSKILHLCFYLWGFPLFSSQIIMRLSNMFFILMNFLVCQGSFFSFKNTWFTTVRAVLFLSLYTPLLYFVATTLYLVLSHTSPHLIIQGVSGISFFSPSLWVFPLPGAFYPLVFTECLVLPLASCVRFSNYYAFLLFTFSEFFLALFIKFFFKQFSLWFGNYMCNFCSNRGTFKIWTYSLLEQ